MFRRDPVLPLAGDASSRFLPWIVALMVFLATLAVALAIAVSDATERWERGLTSRLTVELPPVLDGGPGADATRAERLQAAIAILERSGGVLRVEPVPPDAARSLLEPWLGDGALAAELPLPQLIDVIVDGAGPDVAGLTACLDAAVPGAVVDDHRRWLDRLQALAGSLQAVAMLVVLAIAGTGIIAVIFATRTGLAVHREVIEVLHLIGARDSYVARQFARHALLLGLRGGAIGVLAGGGALALLGAATRQVDTLLLPRIALAPWEWALLASLPLASALLAMVTAGLTVQRALARLP